MRSMTLALAFLIAAPPAPARGDALWQWYAEGVNCNAVGAQAQLEIAREHNLKAVANGSRAERYRYFAKHPELDQETAQRMELLGRYCRDTD
jgi:hypothetical protein